VPQLQVPPLLEGLVSDGVGAGAFWQKRWTVVGLCFVAFLLCNLDRVNMSVAILPMASQFGWDAATMGLVQSSFFWWVGEAAPVRAWWHGCCGIAC
jgi:hypothetical protein